MPKRTYEIDILARIDKAIQSIEQLTGVTQEKLDNLNFNTGISAIVDVYRLAQGPIQKVGELIGHVINEAVAAEKSVNALANSLRITGDYSEAAVVELVDFANETARLTTLTDDQVVAGLSLAKSFQLTNTEAKNVINAAKELSAITGADLNSSVEKLAKTYNGFLDKGLKQLIPELKNLTAEQLASGEAVEIVAQRFGGSAAEALKNYGDIVSEAGQATSELAGTLGSIITRSEGARGFFQQITADIQALNDAIKAGNFTNLFFNLQVGEGFSDAANRLKDIEAAAVDAEQAIKNAMRANTRPAGGDDTERQIKAQRELQLAREKALEEFNSIRNQLEIAGLSDIEKINKEAAKNIAIVRKAIDTGAIRDRVQAQKYIENVQIESAKRVAEEQKKITEKQIAEEKKLREQTVSRNKNISNLDFAETGDLSSIEDLTAASLGILKNIVKGAQGAVDVISKGIGAAADLILPGIGGVVSDIVGVLSQGPEKTKQMVEEFARAIPQIIENLAESLPVLIEALVRELPPALAKAMPTVAYGFSIALIQNIPNIVKGFAQGLIDAAKQAGQALIDMIKDIPGGIWGGVTGKDSGGIFEGIPILGGIGDLFGFAEGGRVPDLAQFQGDKFGPVMLDRNEQVLNGDLTQRLERYLNAGGDAQPRNITVIVKLDRSELARANLSLDRDDYRTEV